MKSTLTFLILFVASNAFSQVIETAVGRVDLQHAAHHGAYLQRGSDSHNRSKIIWYPDYNLYRDCGDFKALKVVPDGYYLVDEDCQCVEKFGGIIRPTAAAAAYSNVQFDFDSSVLKASDYPMLDLVAADLKSTGATVELDGYASSEGTAAHNMRLSRDRANSVKTYLVNSGVSTKKLKVKAYGETHPIADNSTEEGRVKNRRVEFNKQ